MHRGWVYAWDAPSVSLESLIVIEIVETNHIHHTDRQVRRWKWIPVEVRNKDLFTCSQSVSHNRIGLYLSSGHGKEDADPAGCYIGFEALQCIANGRA